MKKSFTSTALALCLAAPIAFAQTALATSNFMTQQTSGQSLASSLMDKNVYTPAGDKIGEITDLVLDQSSGAPAAAVIGVGGFLGIGEKYVAVPFRDVAMTMKDGKEWLTVNATKDELKAAPEFVPLKDRVRAAAVPAPVPAPVKASPPAATAPAAGRTASATPPLPGANSFTEGQARSRIESMGYSNVTGLTKDDQSVWHATAMKDGKSTTVMLDFKGNVVAQ